MSDTEAADMEPDAPSAASDAVVAAQEQADEERVIGLDAAPGESDKAVDAEGVSEEGQNPFAGVLAAIAGAEDVDMADVAPLDTGTEPYSSAFTAHRSTDAGPPTSTTSTMAAAAADAEEVAPLSSPELSFPSAAQPHPAAPSSSALQRPATPPRHCSYSTTGVAPSSASSADTLVAGTQNTALGTPSRRTPTASGAETLLLTQTELASGGEDSPDPLRIVPTPSPAAASVSRSNAVGIRSRSVTPAPCGGMTSNPLQSSPIRGTSGPGRQRSKTPSFPGPFDGRENLDPLATGKAGSRRGGPSGQRGMSALAEAPGGDEDDDELMMRPVQVVRATSAGPVRPVKRAGSNRMEPYLDIPVAPVASSSTSASRSGSGRKSRSASRSVPPKVKQEDDADELEMDFEAAAALPAASGSGARNRRASTEKPSQRQAQRATPEHKFSLVIPTTVKARENSPSNRRSRPSSRSPASTPRPSRPSSPRALTSANEHTTASSSAPDSVETSNTSTESQPQQVPHPLSQTLAAQNETTLRSSVAPTSPLSSLPPSTADNHRTSPAPSRLDRAPTKRVRSARKSEAHDAFSTDDELAHAERASGSSSSSSLGADHPSPKKKPRSAKVPAEPKKKPRRSLFARSESEKEEEEEAEPVKGKGRGKKATKPAAKSKAKGKGKVKRDKEEEELDVDADELPSPVRRESLGLRASRNGGRRKSMKEASSSSASDGEESEDDAGSGSETEFEEKKATPKKRGRPPKSAASAKGGSTAKGKSKAGATEKKAASAKGKAAKGKGKAKAKENANVQISTSAASSSPHKLPSLRPTSSLASQLLAPDAALPETPEQRAKGWSLNTLPTGKPVWAHVASDAEGGGFWWPAEVHGNVWDKPFTVKLYIDAGSTVLECSPELVSYPIPSAADVLTFRNPIKLRFDRFSFQDGSSAAPSAEAFASVLEQAIAKDAQADDDEDSDDGLPPPSSFGAGPTKGKKRAEPESDTESEVEVALETESEDELLKDEDEAAGIEFPAVCIAKYRTGWWAAQVKGYQPPPKPSPSKAPPKNGRKPAKPKGKFLVEYTDDSTGLVTRANLLLPRDKRFFTVSLGETKFDIPNDYDEQLREFSTVTAVPTYQSIINETYPPAQRLNDAFYAAGKARSELVHEAKYGELSDEHVDVMREGIEQWMKSGGEDGGRPTGSKRFEALTDSERATYAADILLSTCAVLNYMVDQKLEQDAEKEIRKEGNLSPDKQEVELRAFKRAKHELDNRSVTKAVHAIRKSKGIVAQAKAQSSKK
ncbi:hypothetical protein JCM10213_005603 [Rhodosporidiobolus nylandii]